MRKYRTGITEKRLNNKRFQKTEDAILAVFFAMRGYVSMSKIATKIGVARSTIYIHHPSINDVIADYEKYILQKYKKRMRKILEKDSVQTKVIYRQMLLFILQNKDVFKILLHGRDRSVLTEMVRYVMGVIQARMKLPKGHKIGEEIYIGSVVEILLKWKNDGAKATEMGKVLGNIMYVTSNSREWVKPILD